MPVKNTLGGAAAASLARAVAGVARVATARLAPPHAHRARPHRAHPTRAHNARPHVTARASCARAHAHELEHPCPSVGVVAFALTTTVNAALVRACARDVVVDRARIAREATKHPSLRAPRASASACMSRRGGLWRRNARKVHS